MSTITTAASGRVGTSGGVLLGDAKAYRVHGLGSFSREKAVTSRWLDPAPHGGLDLGFPQNG